MSDLFSDLHGSTRGEIEKRISDLDEQKRSLAAHITTRKKERSGMIERVKAARAAMSALSPKKEELRQKRAEIRELQGAVNAARRSRDAINALVPLPYNRVVERAESLKAKLTGAHPQNPFTLDEELTLLKEFLSLQAQISYKKSSNSYHQTVAKGLERIGILRQEISASKRHHEEQAKSLAKTNDHLKSADLSFKTIKKLSGRIDVMMKELKGMYDHQRQINRELGRLHAFIKHVLDSGGKKRGGARHLEKRVLSGETFGMEDLARLMKSGGIGNEALADEKKNAGGQGKVPQPKRRRQISAKRGQGRIGRVDPDKRR